MFNHQVCITAICGHYAINTKHITLVSIDVIIRYKIIGLDKRNKILARNDISPLTLTPKIFYTFACRYALQILQ